MCERYHTYSRDCQKLFSEHLLSGDNNFEKRLKNEHAFSRSTPTRNVMGERYHRVQTAAMNTFRQHHSKSFPTTISTISNRTVDDGVMINERLAFVRQHRDKNVEQRVKNKLALSRSTPTRNVMGERYHRVQTASMNTFTEHHSKSCPTRKSAAMNTFSERHSKSFPTIKENATSCWEGNEVNKPRNFSFCSNSLKELFIAMKLEGAIVQTASGPDGSFRVGTKVGTNGSFRVSSPKHKELTAISAQEMWVLRLLRMFSSAAYFSSRPTIKAVKRVFTVLMVLQTAIETFLFPTSDIEALNDRYDFEESLSLYFYYLLHFTFLVISLPTCYYLDVF